MTTATKNKALIITGLNEELQQLFPTITKREDDQLIVSKSFGTDISQPYGCMMRNIIMAVHYENVDEVYIIAEKDSEEQNIDKEELSAKIKQSGVSQDTLSTIEYIGAVGDDVLSWLAGDNNEKEVIEKNIDLIKNHPLIPESVSVYGYIGNVDTGEYEAVYGKEVRS